MRHLLAAAMLGLATISRAQATGPWDTLKTWTILVAPDANPSEQYAAEEFRTLFKQALEAELPVTYDKSIKQNVFRIGPGAAENPTEEFGEEELLIQIHRHDVIITGGRPRGTLYGVYEFFERYLNGEFLTYDHTWFPESTALKPLPVEDYRYQNRSHSAGATTRKTRIIPSSPFASASTPSPRTNGWAARRHRI